MAPSKRVGEGLGYLTYVNPQTQTEQTTLIDTYVFTIGRSATCDITVYNKVVSRIHCILELKNDGHWTLTDKSSTGTFVNRLQVSGVCSLEDGDTISLSSSMNFPFHFTVGAPVMCKRALLDRSNGSSPASGKEDLNDTNILEPKQHIAELTRQIKEAESSHKATIENYKTEAKVLEIRLDANFDHINLLKDEIGQLKKKLEEQDFELAKSKSELFSKDSVIEIVENELQCPICNEIVLEPSVLNCGHLFCSHCITTWLARKKECAVCRTPVRHNIKLCRAVDTLIDKLLERCSPETHAHRVQLLNERKISQSVAAVAPTRRRGNHAVRQATVEAVMNDVILAADARITTILDNEIRNIFVHNLRGRPTAVLVDNAAPPRPRRGNLHDAPVIEINDLIYDNAVRPRPRRGNLRDAPVIEINDSF